MQICVHCKLGDFQQKFVHNVLKVLNKTKWKLIHTVSLTTEF